MRPFQLILIFSVLFAWQAAAQSCAVVEYSTKDGLPTGGYTYSFQDRAGFLWVGTYISGVARFDGKKWTVFTIKDGLLSNKIDCCWQDSVGRMWFDHGQYGMTMLGLDGKFRPFKPSADRASEIERNAMAPDGQVFFFSQRTHEISRLDPETGEKKPTGILLPGDTFKYPSFLIVRNGRRLDDLAFIPRYAAGQPFKFFKFTGQHWESITYRAPTETMHFADIMDFPVIGNNKTLWFFHNERWENVQPPTIQLLNGEKAPPPTEIQYTHFDHFNQKIYIVWKLAKKAGPPRYLLGEYTADLQLVNFCIFATYHLPSEILKDQAGTYWVACGTALLRIFPYLQNVPIDAPNMLPQTWAVAQAADGQMWFASYGEGLARFDGLEVHAQPDFLKRFTKYDDGSLVDRQTKEMYFNIEGESGIGGLLRFDGKKAWSRLFDGVMATYLAYDKKGQLMRGTFYKGLWILPKGADMTDAKNWRKIDQSKGLEFSSTIHTALEDRYGRYWIGHTNTGLACFDPKTEKISNWTKLRRTENYGVMSMAEDDHGNLWIGTDQGLCFLQLPEAVDNQFDLLAHLKRIALDYLGESLVSVCHLYDKNTLIVGNSLGFFLLDLPAFYAGKTRIYAFTSSTGHLLGSVNQNGIWIDRQKRVWLACSAGVTCFDPQRWVRGSDESATVHIDSAMIGNVVFKDFSSELKVGSGAVFGKIWFSSDSNPQLFNNVRYRYRLPGDTTWSELRKNEVFEFPNLASGHYRFEVQAERNGVFSATTQLRLFVSPLWWQNPGYWLLILGTVIVIGALWRRREVIIADQNLQIANQQLQIEKSINEMGQMSEEKDKLQVQAIVNQLNPHFINNAFHWLRIRLDEQEEAVRMITRLSQNINIVFTNSRNKKSYHFLYAEMKLAANYLFIEKCSFGDKLTYTMPDETALARLDRINVPLLVIQIHAENAIEHGIRNKANGAGHVQISLREEDDYIVIIIEDDGVGREAAKKIGSRGTQQGTKMLRELARIYNRQNLLPLEQYYEDDIFKNRDGTLHGTRAIIRIPKQYNFEF